MIYSLKYNQESKMLKLKDYRNLINLTPKAKNITVLTAQQKAGIVDKLLKTLQQKFSVEIDFATDYQQKRNWLRAILNQLPPCDLGTEFFNLQDQLLSSETNEKNIIHSTDLTFNNQIALYQGDITMLAVDAIVNAGNSQLLGCFVPLHSCIDNIIISSAGFQVRNDLNVIMKKQGHEEPNGIAKITNAYNLPSKYIIHTVGPCIYENITEKHKQDLANCYRSSLNLAKEMDLKSIAFCCISTGEFMFPNDIACKIAVDTVKSWLKANKYDIKVVFNVFKDIDRSYYERKLPR